MYGLGDNPFKNVYNTSNLLRFSRYVPTSKRTDSAWNTIIKLVGNGTQPGGTNAETNPLSTPAYPFDIAFDTSGNVYWTDRGSAGSAYVRRLTVTTNQVSTVIGPTESIGGAVMNIPRGIAIDSNNNMAISDQLNNRILFRPSTSGTFYGISMTANTNYVVVTSANCGDPNMIAFSSNGDIYWANRASAKIRNQMELSSQML